VDLSFTRDRHVVCWHDWDPDDAIAVGRQNALEEAVRCRPIAPDLLSPWRKPVHELTLDELRAHYGYGMKSLGSTRLETTITTFDELLAWAATKPTLREIFLDLKIPSRHLELVDPMLTCIDELLERHGTSCRIVYSTPNMPVLEALERRSFHPNYAYDVEAPLGFVLRPSRFSSVRVATRFKNAFATSVHPKVTTIAPWTTYKRIIRADVRLRDAHNARNPDVPIERVLCATINEPDLARCLIAMGVDGVITDAPDAIREAALELGRTPR
jgi:glycerophosphoryl diester phosphodiesterase